MKVICASDAHTDARCCGVERFDEVREAFEEAEACASSLAEAAEEVLFAFCGDLCDGDDGRDVLRAVSLALGAADRMVQRGVRQLWVCGNHDVLGDGTTTLDPLAALEGSYDVATSPLRFLVRNDLAVLAMPYSPSPYDAAAALDEFLKETKGFAQRIVFSHLMLPGMHPGSESVEMARGRDRMFPVDLLKGQRRLTVVQGHYHAGQTLKFHGVDVHVVGSMALNTFSEEGNVPSFLVLDVQRDGVRVERIPFADSRRMVTLRQPADATELGVCEGAFVRMIEPLSGMPADVLSRFVEAVRSCGPLAVKVVNAPRAEVALEPKSERSDPKRRSAREVVMGMVDDARTADREKLRTFVEAVVDDAGL